jgi:hypothetical protein
MVDGCGKFVKFGIPIGTSISMTRDWVKLNLESQVDCDMTLCLSVSDSRRLE